MRGNALVEVPVFRFKVGWFCVKSLGLLLEVLIKIMSIYVVQGSAVVAKPIPGRMFMTGLTGLCWLIFQGCGWWLGRFRFWDQGLAGVHIVAAPIGGVLVLVLFVAVGLTTSVYRVGVWVWCLGVCTTC